jgi:hypothetical protein
MGVLSVDLQSDDSRSLKADSNGWVQATGQRVFLSTVETAFDTIQTVEADPRIPKNFEAHPLFPFMTVKDRATKQKGLLQYVTTVSYESPEYTEGFENPILQPTQISYSTITSDEEIDTDLYNRSICTSVGEPVAGLTKSVSDLGIRLQRNFIDFSPAAFYTYQDSVNSDSYLGFPPGTLKVASITADKQIYNKFTVYYSVQIEIHARKPYLVPPAQAWWKRYLNQGYLAKWDNGRIGRMFDNVTQQPISQPIKIALDGTPLSDQTSGIWLTRQVYPTISFASMGF